MHSKHQSNMPSQIKEKFVLQMRETCFAFMLRMERFFMMERNIMKIRIDYLTIKITTSPDRLLKDALELSKIHEEFRQKIQNLGFKYISGTKSEIIDTEDGVEQ